MHYFIGYLFVIVWKYWSHLELVNLTQSNVCAIMNFSVTGYLGQVITLAVLRFESIQYSYVMTKNKNKIPSGLSGL